MPKKCIGENSKAVIARARKAAVKEAEAAKAQQAIEDEYWKDDDKHVQRKQQRKEDKERKRQEQLDKKAEKKTLAEQELCTIAPTKVAPLKVTRATIQSTLEKKPKEGGENAPPVETHLTKPLEENINRMTTDGLSARSVDEAISILSVNEEPLDGQKSLKSAFVEFENTHLPRLKAENPTLRLSQLKQLLRKEWLRSSENPVNQWLNK